MAEFLRLAGHAGNAGLDFDFPDQDPAQTATGSTRSFINRLTSTCSMAWLPRGDTHFSHFRIDVSDEYAKLSGQFTLREFPTCDGLRNASVDAALACAVAIPEPSLWSLLGAAFAGLVMVRKPRRRGAARLGR